MFTTQGCVCPSEEWPTPLARGVVGGEYSELTLVVLGLLKLPVCPQRRCFHTAQKTRRRWIRFRVIGVGGYKRARKLVSRGRAHAGPDVSNTRPRPACFFRRLVTLNRRFPGSQLLLLVASARCDPPCCLWTGFPRLLTRVGRGPVVVGGVTRGVEANGLRGRRNIAQKYPDMCRKVQLHARTGAIYGFYAG